MLDQFKNINPVEEDLPKRERGDWDEKAAKELIDEIHHYFDQPNSLFLSSFLTLKKKITYETLYYLNDKFVFFKREFLLFKQIQEAKLIEAVVDGKIDKSFAQFLMKNWFNYQDKIDQTITNIQPPTINVHSDSFKLRYNQPQEQKAA